MATIVVRGATENIMDDFERAIDDGVNVYKAVTKDQRFLPGAGAVEIELALQLASWGQTQPGLEQYAIAAFAEALEVIPQALAENAGMKGKDAVSLMYTAHKAGQANVGLDMDAEKAATKDAAVAGIYDHFLTKFWGLKYANSAATTVLRVDQVLLCPLPPPTSPSIHLWHRCMSLLGMNHANVCACA